MYHISAKTRSFEIPPATYSSWLCLFALLCNGCSNGIPQYEISGEITLDGKPVQQGRIIFTPKIGPDGYGAQGVARVENGKIISHDEKRVIGGSYTLQIIGFDGVPFKDGSGATNTMGQPLFQPLRAQVDLPTQDVSLNIRVQSEGKDHQVEIKVLD